MRPGPGVHPPGSDGLRQSERTDLLPDVEEQPQAAPEPVRRTLRLVVDLEVDHGLALALRLGVAGRGGALDLAGLGVTPHLLEDLDVEAHLVGQHRDVVGGGVGPRGLGAHPLGALLAALVGGLLRHLVGDLGGRGVGRLVGGTRRGCHGRGADQKCGEGHDDPDDDVHDGFSW